MLAANGLDATKCELEPWLEAPRTMLHHRPSKSFVDIVDSGDPIGYYRYRWHVEDGPASPGITVCRNWGDLLEQIAYWAEEVAYVIETSDLWAELKRAPEIMTVARAAEPSNAPFTLAEQADISRSLDEIKKIVREKFELTSEQMSAIQDRLDDITEASERLNRKDWIMVLYGGLVSTFMTDAVPPGVVQVVLAMVIHAVAHTSLVSVSRRQ